MQTLFVHMKLLGNLFLLCIYQTKNVYKNLLCIHSTVDNLYKNSAVDKMLHLIG